MKTKLNPLYAGWLAKLMQRPELLRPWSGNGFRFVSLAYWKPEQILSGMGSFRNGGRWNAAGSFPAVYCSLTKQTAVLEADAYAVYYGFGREVLRPRLIVAIE